MKNLYFELLNKPVFSVQDIIKYYDNEESARSALKRLIADGLVYKIRNNMYTCKSGENGQPVANKYQIACGVSKDAYISHHSALEYYGTVNQIYYDVYISAPSLIRKFDFDGLHYQGIKTNCSIGIEDVAFSGGIRITNKERAVIDSIKDINKVSGFEEIDECISIISELKESNLKEILEFYENQFLYQKTGYFFEKHKETLKISEAFLDYCRDHIGKSKRYIDKSVFGIYIPKWQIVIPKFTQKNDD